MAKKMQKFAIVFGGLLLLTSCSSGPSEEDIRNSMRKNKALEDGYVFIWDGITVNLASRKIYCTQDEKEIRTYIHGYSVVTYNCHVFLDHLGRCLAARELDGEEEIQAECFDHDFAEYIRG